MCGFRVNFIGKSTEYLEVVVRMRGANAERIGHLLASIAIETK